VSTTRCGPTLDRTYLFAARQRWLPVDDNGRMERLIPVAVVTGFVLLIGGLIASMPAARRFDARRATARAASGRRPMSKWWFIGVTAALIAAAVILSLPGV
jgi:hypothetical protein